MGIRAASRRWGGTTAEHVVVLGAVVTVALAAAAAAGLTTRSCMARLFLGSAGGAALRAKPPDTADHTPILPRSSAPAKPWTGTGGELAAMAVAGVLLVIAGSVIARARRKPPGCGVSAAPDRRDDDWPLVTLRDRLYAKRQSLLRFLTERSDSPQADFVAVRHLMTNEITSVAPEAGLDEVNRLITENLFRHLLVCSDEGELLGVISNRDLRGRPGQTAGQIMSSPAYTVSPETPLTVAATCMIHRHISCLPVVSEGRLCGVVTTTDLVLILQCVLQLWLAAGGESEGDFACAELAT